MPKVNKFSKLLLQLICIGAVSGLSACSMFSKKPKNLPSELVVFTQTATVKTAWKNSVGKSGDYEFSPVAAGDSIVAASADGTIVRLDAATGQTKWKITAESNLTAGVGVDVSANAIAVAGSKGALLVYDLDGKLRWTAQASSDILAAPAVGDGVVVVRSVDNHIAAFELDTGKRRWVVERTLPLLTARTGAGLVINRDNVIVAVPGGKLVSMALINGGVRWESAVGESRGATELERVVDTAGVPAVYGADVCSGAYQGRVACFDVNSGVQRWSKTLSTALALGVDERFVFAADDRGTVNAFSRTYGQSEWRNDKLSYRGLSSPISFGRAVVIADASGYVHFLSREDGSFLARTATDGSAITASPVIVGSNVVFQTKAGEIVALAID